MKALVFLFFCIVVFGVGLRYTPKNIRKEIRCVAVNNLWVILLALVAVAFAIFFSINTTMRLV